MLPRTQARNKTWGAIGSLEVAKALERICWNTVEPCRCKTVHDLHTSCRHLLGPKPSALPQGIPASYTRTCTLQNASCCVAFDRDSARRIVVVSEPKDIPEFSSGIGRVWEFGGFRVYSGRGFVRDCFPELLCHHKLVWLELKP